MRFILGIESRQGNATVVFEDCKADYTVLVNGETGKPLVFDDADDALQLKRVTKTLSGYYIIPINYQALGVYPQKSAFHSPTLKPLPAYGKDLQKAASPSH